MPKYFTYLLVACILCSCIKRTENKKSIHVSILRGPSSIAFAQWLETPPLLNGKTVVIHIYDSPEQIQAALIKEDTDMAVLPMINAANLYNKGLPYLLAGCPLWGTLFIVGKKDFSSLHIFGTGTTPDILTRYFLETRHQSYHLNYSFGTASEITQGLLLGKIEAAVLSEPFVSIALQKDTTLQILADLNNPSNENIGFAQTAVLFHSSLLTERNELDSLLLASSRFAEENPQKVIEILEENQLFPKGLLTNESIQRNRIHYLPARESAAEIYSFLKIIEQYEPKAIGGKLPANDFITGTP